MLKKISKNIGMGILSLTLIGATADIYAREVSKAKVFVTAFGPYEGRSTNPTMDITDYLSKKGYSTEVFDVDYKKAPERLRNIISNHKPRAIISLGVKDGVKYFNLSTTAKNIMFAKEPDVSGVVLNGKTIDDKFPEKIQLSKEKIRFAKKIFRSSRVKYDLETDANTYVCNALLFTGIVETMKTEDPLFYFLHVPKDVYTNKKKFGNLMKAIESIVGNI